MKGHTSHHRTHSKHAVHHHHYARGGSAEHGVKEWEQDLRENPESRVNAPKITHEAEAKKHGGRAKRKHGGHVMGHTHHEHGKHLAHAKHVGPVHGHKAAHHAGRKPRKAGGSDMSPLSSAHRVSEPRGHKSVTEE